MRCYWARGRGAITLIWQKHRPRRFLGAPQLVQLWLRIKPVGVPNIRMWGARGDGLTDDYDAIQTAIDFAIQTSVALFAPSGTYIIGSGSADTALSPAIYLSNLTASGQGLTLFGEGRGKTIFKEADGKTRTGGRYTKMFYCWLDDPESRGYKFGFFTFSDITFDKNGRSNFAPPTLYEWEQSHIIQWAGSGVDTVAGVSFDRCEFLDKTAACINISSTPTEFDSVLITDCQSVNHPTALSGEWGHRGCYEFGADTRHTVLTGSTGLYTQIEPVTASGPSRVRRYRISNCHFEHALEFTDSGGYSYVDVSSTTCVAKLLVRGMWATITNSRFSVPDYFTAYGMNITNSVITLPLVDKVVKPLYIFGMNGVKTRVVVSNSDFRIDSLSTKLVTRGFALQGVLKTTPDEMPEVFIDNCLFDERLAGTLNGYQGGHWVLSNCKMAGTEEAVRSGSYSNFLSHIELNNCDFGAVTGKYLRTYRNNDLWTLKINGNYRASEWNQSYSGAGNTANRYIGRPSLWGSAPPSTGTWMTGDRVLNDAPASGGVQGWVCVAQGTPGVWGSFGVIA